MAPQAILGISADYHDAAACLVVDGEIVAAAEEERFSRRKHDPSLPEQATAWCLDEAALDPGDLAAVSFYSKPLTTYERILRTHALVGPAGFASLSRAIRVWSGSKLWLPLRIDRMLARLGHPSTPLHFAEHHVSHAASAFLPSPFERAAVITCDGVGEWATSSIGLGDGNRVRLLEEQFFPDSVGLFYSAMTAQCGFEVNDGEYRLMGLAPYGQPRFTDALRAHAIDVHHDGSVTLDQGFFGFRAGRRMGSRRMDDLLEGPPLPLGADVTDREADIAASAQAVVEEIVLAMAAHAHALTGATDVCLAGGVALNCVANERLLRDGPFERMWVQPAAGDGGGAVGAALWTWHELWDKPRALGRDRMRGSALGPSYGSTDISAFLERRGVIHEVVDDDERRFELVAELLDGGSVVGWFEGPMEFGPRALGRRSILADPRDPAMSHRLNRMIKEREGFRPFAPAVLAEEASAWFDLDAEAPYMVLTAPVVGAAPASATPDPRHGPLDLASRLGRVKSPIPACTHVDGSARVQTVDIDRSPVFHGLLRAFQRRTGCPVLLNTSFNGRGEPIVCTPADAWATFLATGLDVLVMERCVVLRTDLDPAATA